MDFVAKTEETNIPLILQDTLNAFMPLMEKHRAEIESIKRETFKFGDTDRHQLDVYYPPNVSSQSSTKPPILFFAYGGGFTAGNRVYPAPNDLLYKNLGAFFATRGILTIIPDYRLVPGAVFPSGGEDIRDAIIWSIQNVTEGDTHKLFVMGHSAGAVHVATMFLQPGLLDKSTVLPHVKGAILIGAPYHFHLGGQPDVLTQYYGDADAQAKAKCPYGLLEANPVPQLPPIFFLMSEKEPPYIAIPGNEFVKLFNEKTGGSYVIKPMKGHNHISPHLALGTGQGEEWGEDVAAWVKERA